MDRRDNTGNTVVSACVLHIKAGGAHYAIILASPLVPPTAPLATPLGHLSRRRSFRLRRHSPLRSGISRVAARSAYGATRSLRSGIVAYILTIYYQMLNTYRERCPSGVASGAVGGTTLTTREMPERSGEWRRRRNERRRERYERKRSEWRRRRNEQSDASLGENGVSGADATAEAQRA